MTLNSTVVAVRQVTEEGFNGTKVHTHAEPGDKGTVVHVDESGAATVRFHRTGTATLVDPDEVAPEV